MELKQLFPANPLAKTSAVDYVIEQIKDLLMKNILKPGDHLPSEGELCELLNVSRGSLRSAMKVFEACGVVDIRIGDGTYVCSSLSSKNLNPLIFSLLIARPNFKEFVQFREKVELDILELIIKDDALSEAILPKLEKNLAALHALQAECAAPAGFWENEKEFHSILAGGCNNIIFQTVYSFIFEFFSTDIENSHKRQDFGKVVIRDHERIYNAIRTRSFSMAKTAIVESMDSWVNLLKGTA